MDDGSRLWLLTLGALLCIIIMAVFTACEAAVTELNDSKIRKNAESDVKWEKVLRLVSRPTRIIVSMSVFRLLMTCAAAFIASAAWHETLGGLLAELVNASSDLAQTAAELVAVILVVLVVTVLASAIGINFPKRLGGDNAEKYALRFCGLLGALIVIITPLEKLADGIVFILCKLSGIKDFSVREAVTEEEILMMVDAANETGGLENSQKEMISNIFEFGDIEISGVMTHRTEICGVDVNQTLKEAIGKVIDEGFSRIPVYDGSVDDIIGVLFAKDMLSSLTHENADKITIRHLMREILYVPETNSCDELFKQFTKSKAQIAVVVDEYGGTAGIVTMEDLLETIVGNIQDEYDDEQEEIVKLDEDSYRILGNASPDEVMELFGYTLPEEHDYDTIGGFVIDKLGYIPNDNETPQIDYEGLRIQVIKTEDKKIEELIVTVIRDDGETEQTEE